MAYSQYQALIVDDDPAVRRLVTLALNKEGFHCMAAEDGVDAAEQIANSRFDLVITDLAMPQRHGHSLAISLLALPDRPVIVVFTGIIEPRLTKDLIARGVDDVISKPVKFSMLAAKMRSLVDRHHARSVDNSSATPPGGLLSRLTPITFKSLTDRVVEMAQLLPISAAAIDVYCLASSGDATAVRIAAALERDASLVAEVLRIANSGFHNRTPKRIVELEHAVLRIGQKRIGELALAVHALGAMTSAVVPWMNTAALWRRSIAAGAAMELLSEQIGHDHIATGLMAGAIMHSLGRLVLALLYPLQYQEMIIECRASEGALSVVEAQVFPEPHWAVIARLLNHWNVPADIYLPISVFGQSYDELAQLPEPLRSKAELLKLAVMMGDLAVGQWETWDLLEFPRASVLSRLGIHDVSALIENTVANFEAVVRNDGTPAEPRSSGVANSEQSGTYKRQLCYRSLCPITGPLLLPLLSSFDLQISESEAGVPLLVNALGFPLPSLRSRLAGFASTPAVILVDESRAVTGRLTSGTVKVPCSYASLQQSCLKAATDANGITAHPLSIVT